MYKLSDDSMEMIFFDLSSIRNELLFMNNSWLKRLWWGKSLRALVEKSNNLLGYLQGIRDGIRGASETDE